MMSSNENVIVPSENQLHLIHHLFSNSLSTSYDVRKQVETQLNQLAVTKGFLPSLLSFIKKYKDINPSIAFSASIYFKNKLVKVWKLEEEKNKENVNLSSPSSTSINSNPVNFNALSHEDKSFIYENILPLYMESSVNIRKILLACISKIIDPDYLKNWSQLLPTLFHFLQTGSTSDLLNNNNNLFFLSGALDILLEVVEARNTTSKYEGNTIIFKHAFPSLILLSNSLLVSLSSTSTSTIDISMRNQVCYNLKTIFKIYYHSILYILPKELSTPEMLQSWLSIFFHVLNLSSPPHLKTADMSDEELAAAPFWKMVKYCYHSINRLFVRYGAISADKIRGAHYEEFAKLFSRQCSAHIVELYLQTISKLVVGQSPVSQNNSDSTFYLPNKIVVLICDLISACIRPKKLWTIIKPHSQSLIRNFIFPRICYSDEDESLFKEDPYEYIHKEINSYDDRGNVNKACMNLLLDLLKMRKKAIFFDLVQFVNEILTKYADDVANHRQPHFKSKEGALYILGSIVYHILNSDYKSHLENILVNYIVKDLSSENPLIRFRAAWVIEHLEDLEYSQIENVHCVLFAILHGMSDSELPVRIQCAISLGIFLEYEESRPVLIQHLPAIIQSLLDLTNVSDLDSISYVLDKLVCMFPEEMTPYALHLIIQLKESLMRLLKDPKISQELRSSFLPGDTNSGKGGFIDPTISNSNGIVSGVDVNGDDDNNDDDDNFEESSNKYMTAVGIMKTMSTLILTIKNNPELVLKIEEVCIEPIHYILSNRICDFYEEVFEIVEPTTSLSKTISPHMWNLFPNFMAIVQGPHGVMDYLEDLVPVIDNYLSFGKEVFISNTTIQHMILKLVETIMTDGVVKDPSTKENNADRDPSKGYQFGDNDRICACQIMGFLLLNYHGQINQYLLYFLEWTLNKFPRYNSKSSIVHHMEIVLNAIMYDAKTTISWLRQKNILAPVLDFWIKHKDEFKTVYDKRLILLSVNALLSLDSSVLPEEIVCRLPNLFDMLKMALETLPASLEEKRRLEENYENEDSDYSSYDEDDDEDEDFGENEDEDEIDHTSEKEMKKHHRQGNNVIGDGHLDELSHTYGNGISENESSSEIGDRSSLEDSEDSEDESDIWYSDDELEEHLFWETPLDFMDIHGILKSTLSNLPNVNPNVFNLFNTKVSEADKAVIVQCLNTGIPKIPSTTAEPVPT